MCIGERSERDRVREGGSEREHNRGINRKEAYGAMELNCNIQQSREKQFECARLVLRVAVEVGG